MKLAFSGKTQSPQQQRELFASFAEVGYDGLQLKGEYYPYLDEPRRFREDHPAPGAAAGLIAGGRLDDEGVARLRAIIAFAGAVGSERVIFCHGHPRAGLTPEDIRGFARRLTELGGEARDAGTKLSLHNHCGHPVMTAEDARVFFDAADAEAVGLTVDTAHLVKAGEHDVAGFIRDFAGAIDNLHMKDLAGGEWRVLGEGEIDFAPIFAAVQEIGFDGWVSADEESGADLRHGMEACHAFLREGLGVRT